jgi:hypothetical protein
MWIQKIRRGVLQVETDAGLRYVEPSFGQRLQLLWTFRNFSILSEDVLNQHERQLMGELCRNLRPVRNGNGMDGTMPGPIIGILELNRSAMMRKKTPHGVNGVHRNSA